MKASSLPNFNRETTSFPNFFTLYQDPNHHDDTTIHEHPDIDHSEDTEASETSPFKRILSPSASFNEKNENHYPAAGSFYGWDQMDLQPPIPDSSLNFTDQIGNANSGDWQDEICQKINVMKEAYLPELTEMYWKIAGKLQQYDSLPQQPKHEQLEKLKSIKTMFERILQWLQVPKSSILPNFKEKVGAYEKHIISIVNLNRLRKPASLQHGQQILPPHIQSIPLSQQSKSQITLAQPMHENQTKPQPQSMNLQGSSVATMQQNNVSMMDRIAGSVPGNGSKFFVCEDLVAMTKWHLQARNMSMQDTNIGTWKMRRYTSAMPLNVVPSSGSANDRFKHLTCSEISDSESTATSRV